MKPLKRLLALAVFGATTAAMLAPVNASNVCQDYFNQSPKSYPYFISKSKNPEKHFQFGFESEYTLSEVAPLLKYYKPNDISAHTWESMSDAARTQTIKNSLERAVTEIRVLESGLYLYKDIAGAPKIPKQLSIDTTGNLEIIVPPMNSQAEYLSTKNTINNLFGTGSMQTTFSVPWADYFSYLKKSNKTMLIQRKHLESVEGYFKLTSEIDTFQKLEIGYERSLSGKGSQVARSFTHPFLGPVSHAKQEMSMNYMVANANGEKLTPQALGDIKNMESSFKYSGTTVYRPDIAPNKALVWEIRDAHKDNGLIEQKLSRHLTFFSADSKAYSTLVSLKSFDPIQTFDSMPVPVKSLLEKVIGSKALPNVEYTREETLAFQVYRNFSWPMRDWGTHIHALKLSASDIVALKKNQWAYIADLTNTEKKLSSAIITKDQAMVEIQNALVAFAHKTGFSKKLQELDLKLLNNAPSRLGAANE